MSTQTNSPEQLASGTLHPDRKLPDGEHTWGPEWKPVEEKIKKSSEPFEAHLNIPEDDPEKEW